MKLLDVNILLYATSPLAPKHVQAREWLEELMNSGERVGMPWHTLVGFVRLATVSTLPAPLTMDAALEFVEDWLEWDTVWTPLPTERHMDVMATLLRQFPHSRLTPDAHLAALAIEHNLTLCSADADFKRFPGLRFHNPLE